MKTKPMPDHRNQPTPPCSRCGCAPGDQRWVAASPSAERVSSELRLCEKCVNAFRTFIANGQNRPVTSRKEPDRPSVSPPPKTSPADEVPIKRGV